MRPEKLKDVLEAIQECIANDCYAETKHAMQRQKERKINRFEVINILERGYHEKNKDQFQAESNTWNYAIRGKTFTQRDLRVVICFEEQVGLLIVTVIEIEETEKWKRR